jgi:hypothetical protein
MKIDTELSSQRRYMQSITQSILNHTKDTCATLLPLMEQSQAAITYTTSMQFGGGYTITITLQKKEEVSVLGKRIGEDMEEVVRHRPFVSSSEVGEFDIRPHSDYVLHNNFGHAFDTNLPQPCVMPSSMQSYIT